jgi:hypothetical protein
MLLPLWSRRGNIVSSVAEKMPTDTETVGPKWLNFSIRAKEAYVSF